MMQPLAPPTLRPAAEPGAQTLHAAIAVALSVILVAVAGCLSTGTSAGSGEANVPTAAPTPGPGASSRPAEASPFRAPAVWTVANWTGFMKIGAADEAPSHVQETNAATSGIWSPSFHYGVQQVPQALEIRLDWTAAAGQIEFMVVLPGNGTNDEAMVETGFADHGPLCARLPTDHLVPGTYSVMAHSQYAVDARLLFSVLSLGGNGRLVDEPHTSPAAEFPAYLASLLAGGDAGTLAPEPCAPG
jgi:hypothetical protein